MLIASPCVASRARPHPLRGTVIRRVVLRHTIRPYGYSRYPYRANVSITGIFIHPYARVCANPHGLPDMREPARAFWRGYADPGAEPYKKTKTNPPDANSFSSLGRATYVAGKPGGNAGCARRRMPNETRAAFRVRPPCRIWYCMYEVVPDCANEYHLVPNCTTNSLGGSSAP